MIILLVMALQMLPIYSLDCAQGWDTFVSKKHGKYCYYMADYKETYAVHSRDCQDRGAELVSIHSKEENEFVKGLMARQQRLNMVPGYHPWLGLRRVGYLNLWRWEDGTRLDFEHWGYHGEFLDSLR